MSLELAGLAALSAIAIAIAVGRARPSAAAIAAAAAAIAAAAFFAALDPQRTPAVDLDWLPPVGSRFRLVFDSLARPILLFATLLAAPALVYARGYLAAHLAERGRPQREQTRFCRDMLLFMAAMVVLLVADDLLVLFLALDAMAVASFLLIEFDREDRRARRAATTALLVTLGSSLVFLVGALALGRIAGTTVLSELRPWADGDSVPTVIGACLAIGAIGKSAQVPLHFWLPRAMAAPTPVSAYLHSAALVAAGVFVLLRIDFLLAAAPGIPPALLVVGFLSIAVGSALALTRDSLKEILAYSTIAQYGTVVVLAALAGKHADAGAPLAIVAHGLCKATLFLVAGAVTHATGAERLSESGGLLRRMPLLAAVAAVAGAGLAGFPGTIGFWKDELFFAAAREHGTTTMMLATAAAAATVAYTARFWLGTFAGRPPKAPASDARQLVIPLVPLALAVIAGGFAVKGLASTFAAAGSIVAGHPSTLHLAYAPPPHPETVMALVAWALGVVAVALRPRWEPRLRGAVERLSAVAGPAIVADGVGSLVRATSERLHGLEIRDLRDRVRAVWIPIAVLVAAALVADGVPAPAAILPRADEAETAAALFAVALAAVAVLGRRSHVSLTLHLSFAGFALATAFALAGAPDVALVMVLVETALTLLFLGLLWRLDERRLGRARALDEHALRRGPGLFGSVAAVAAALVAWTALGDSSDTPVGHQHVTLAESAHAKDVVTAILADFRGLDTAGEITVLAVAVLGAGAISWGRSRR